MLGPKKQIGRITKKELLAEKVYELEIFLPEPLLFRAGQYVSIKVSESGLRRSYSVVSYREKRILLLVDIGPGGPGSVFFEKSSVDQEVEVMGFLGNLKCKNEDLVASKTIYFVATGTGIAPFLPMLKQLKSSYKGRVVLWWGVRFVRRVYWQEDLKVLKNGWKNFDFEMYVSRPEVDWDGKVGRVGDDLEGVDVANSSWYLCGATEMIEQMKGRLLLKGVSEDDINYEKFF